MVGSALRKAIRAVLCRYWTKRGFNKNRFNSMLRRQKDAFKSSPLPLKQKLWAVKRGFYPFRIQQYGLTDENYRSIVSDFEYDYMCPLNDQYRELVINKLTAWYVLAPFRQYLPKHYYHLMRDRGVLRLADCPRECSASLDGVICLIRSQGIVALKKTDGTHGVGFYKVEVAGDGFIANKEQYTEEQFRAFLKELDDYIITEYVIMHPDIGRLNPDSVNTVRITVVNEHGNDPLIGFAFLRIGTKRSGATDNTGAGGMVCKVDVETGRFYDGEVLKNHIYEKSPFHPDTNIKTEGVIPHWESIKSGIIRICNYIPDLEWLGFDIAVTPDSFSIIEINTSQDIHKAHEYPSAINDYLFRKLKAKKAAYGLKD